MPPHADPPPSNSRCGFLSFSRALCTFLATSHVVLVKCACFGAGELNPPLPPREGYYRVGRKHNNPHVKSNDRSTDRRHRSPGARRSRPDRPDRLHPHGRRQQAQAARKCHRQSRERAVIPVLSSLQCCQRGLVWSPCPRSYPPRSAPAGAVGASSLPSTRRGVLFFTPFPFIKANVCHHKYK
eukprot:scaffold27323_cov124-Isochrysis_galbana.AAC.1